MNGWLRFLLYLQVIFKVRGECIFALPFGFVSLMEMIAGLIGLSEKQCNSRDAYKDCENPKHDWVKGLKVEPSELPGMNPEQLFGCRLILEGLIAIAYMEWNRCLF